MTLRPFNLMVFSPVLLISFLLLLPQRGLSQTTDTSLFKTVIAGKQYARSSLHKMLWGKNYRKDWTTPVRVPIINLDTIHGGLKAYASGGGRQSKTLRLRNPEGKEYVLRSIDKSFGKALPEIARGTFLEDVADDEVSIAEPYAAITISSMAEAAGIYHTTPVIGFIPSQKALGEFDKEYGNDLYLLEQRPDENWEEAPYFGNSKNIVGTDKLFEKILKDPDNSVDQQMYIRARLFDMFLGDWGRHEDQWRWASFKDGKKTVYRPVPRDRDQAYTKIEGLFTKLATSAVADHLEGFGNRIGNLPLYNYPARNLDRRLMNMVPKDQWLSIAAELKLALNDRVIEESINQLPPEVASISAKELISTLKKRREHLSAWAEEYYNFLAQEVTIPATEKSEYIKITMPSASETKVEIFVMEDSLAEKNPYYSRLFNSKETDELRIYGISGNDTYVIESRPDNEIKVRLIGGPMHDSYTLFGPESKVHVYDNPDNKIQKSNITQHISTDSSINRYVYNEFRYDKKGLGISPSYDEEDRIHIALKYEYEKQKWRKEPYGYRHEFAVRYSFGQRAPSIGYSGEYIKLLGNTDLFFGVNYDWIRWNNFYGIGNETKNTVEDVNFNRVRSRQMDGWLGLRAMLWKNHSVSVSTFYQTVKIINDKERFLAKNGFTNFDNMQFWGTRLQYIFQKLDNTILPTKGIRFNVDATNTHSLTKTGNNVNNVLGSLILYVPVTKFIVIKTRTGGAALSGDPEFYQLNKIGGGRSLRGFRRFRFYGEKAFYNQAEVQIIPNIKTYLFNGRAGVIGFYDVGRVWQSLENSDTWHYGYGAGIVISPFNKVAIAVFQGWSRNERAISIRFNAGF